MDLGATLVMTVLIGGEPRTRRDELGSIAECRQFAALQLKIMPRDVTLVDWTCVPYEQRDLPPR